MIVSQTRALKRKRGSAMFPAVTIVARKLFKQTWGLLLVILCSMIAMISLVSAIPLFSQVSIAANVGRIVNSQTGQPTIDQAVVSGHPTAKQVQQVAQKVNQIYQGGAIGAYIDGNAIFSVATPDLQLLSPRTGQVDSLRHVNVLGYDFTQIANDLTIVQGRLPAIHATGSTIEIVISQAVAQQLGLQVGSVREVRFPISMNSTVWRLQVVGIISPKPGKINLWHAFNFTPTVTDNTNNYDIQSSWDGSGSDIYSVVASQQVVLPQIYNLQINTHNTQIGNVPNVGSNVPLVARSLTSQQYIPLTYTLPAHKQSVAQPLRSTKASSGGGNASPFYLYWSYPLAVDRITATTMSNVVDGYNAVYRNFVNGGSSAGYDPNLFYNPPTSFVISQLITEQTTFLFEEVLVGFFLLTIFVLSLYMVSMLSNVLVERQVATIATLRSRGATHRHIFRAFALQCLVVSVLAVGIAPFCAQLVVMVIAHFLLSATDQSAINVVVRNPVGSALSVGWVALIAGLVAVIVMVLAVRRASKIDILTLRRESARTHKKPFWQRLYLDVTLAAIFVSLFSYYYFVVHTFSDTSRILGPLVLLFAPLLLLSILLLFLRLLPFLLRVGAAITARGNGPAGLLSFAQMARQPQTTLRVILLLATVIAFSIYQLSFIATQRYNNQARMEYQVGADFSGSITVKNYHSLQDSEKMYVAMSGVAAATLGYSTSINTSVSDFAGAVTINAVDTNTYAQTAVWSSAYASQPLSSLTSQLAAHRADALNHNVVYAVVNKAIWQDLGLSPGAIFTLPTSDNHFQHIRFVALAYVNFLPTNQNDSLTMLIDYQSYAAAYAKANAGATLQPNYIWLRAHDDANSRAQIQHAFPTLQNLQQLLNQAQTDPSQVAITGTLALGITVLLVLATIGLVLTAWLSVKRRLTSFAILRALGMSSRQVAAILLWEQGTTYLLALLLGVGIGWVLTTFVEPAFQLMDGLVHISISYNVPRMVVLPYSWFGLLVGLFVLVCAILLFFMGRYAAQPAINHMLRLNED